MKKILFCILIASAFMGCTGTVETATVEETYNDDKKHEKSVKILITGMTCPKRCVAEVKRSLGQCYGVKYVDVDFTEKVVTVLGSRDIDEDELLSVLKDTEKYEGTVVQ